MARKAGQCPGYFLSLLLPPN